MAHCSEGVEPSARHIEAVLNVLQPAGHRQTTPSNLASCPALTQQQQRGQKRSFGRVGWPYRQAIPGEVQSEDCNAMRPVRSLAQWKKRTKQELLHHTTLAKVGGAGSKDRAGARATAHTSWMAADLRRDAGL